MRGANMLVTCSVVQGTAAPLNARPCAQCGQSQAHKKVWEKRGRRVLCMACGQRYTFTVEGKVTVQSRFRDPGQVADAASAKTTGQP